jgi:hypothetical protein
MRYLYPYEENSYSGQTVRRNMVMKKADTGKKDLQSIFTPDSTKGIIFLKYFGDESDIAM